MMPSLNQVIEALTQCSSVKDCCIAIEPPWLPGSDNSVPEAYLNVKALIRQRDGLIELFPAQAMTLHAQCEEQIRKVATALRESIYNLDNL